jgi:hypothetical protein
MNQENLGGPEPHPPSGGKGVDCLLVVKSVEALGVDGSGEMHLREIDGV